MKSFLKRIRLLHYYPPRRMMIFHRGPFHDTSKITTMKNIYSSSSSSSLKTSSILLLFLACYSSSSSFVLENQSLHSTSSGSSTTTQQQQQHSHSLHVAKREEEHTHVDTWSTIPFSDTWKYARSYSTPADVYYQTNGKIPLPPRIHASLIDLIQSDTRSTGYGTTSTITTSTFEEVNQENFNTNNTTTNNTRDEISIFIIGDVHGCFHELKSLIDKAIQDNENKLFTSIVFVGDLCNKGPHSLQVLEFIQSQKYWYTVRGNHEDGTLATTLGDVQRRKAKKYQWILGQGSTTTTKEEEEDDDKKTKKKNKKKKKNTSPSSFFSSSLPSSKAALTDDDVDWLANLPYTITIPSSFFGDKQQEDGSSTSASSSSSSSQNTNDNEIYSTSLLNPLEGDVVIVHAGFVPHVDIEKQSIETMITIREVVVAVDEQENSIDKMNTVHNTHYQDKTLKRQEENDSSTRATTTTTTSHHHHNKPWASQWKGKQVIFGHDAKRGLQIHSYAIGLDTGACYGKQLTGIILPSKKIVSVPSKKNYVHS